MKNTLTLFLAVTTVTLAVVCVTQTRKSAGQQTKLASLQGELEEKTRQIEALQGAQKRHDQQRRELFRQADDLSAQLQARQLADTNAAASALTKAAPAGDSERSDEGKAGFGKMLAKMMEDPDAKKVIRDQQRMMMNQLYSPLVKQLGLTSEEADQFKDLLADNAMKNAEKAFSMFDGGLSTNRTELAKTMAAEQKNFDEQVKAFLGDARYAQYKDYQETVGERTQLNAYKQQIGGDLPLSDPQTEQLLAFMKEEKQNVAAATGQPLTGAGQDQAKLEAMLSSEQSDRLLQSQETVNQRVFERAKGILSPEQLDSFAEFQTSQMQMMRMGMRMARQFMSPENPASEPQRPNP